MAPPAEAPGAAGRGRAGLRQQPLSQPECRHASGAAGDVGGRMIVVANLQLPFFPHPLPPPPPSKLGEVATPWRGRGEGWGEKESQQETPWLIADATASADGIISFIVTLFPLHR